MDVNTAASVAQITSVVGSVIFSIWTIYRKLERKTDVVNFEVSKLNQKLDFIEKQFGPNGGGLRQAVNELTDKVDKIQDRQEEIGDKVAELTGKFDQHVRNNPAS